MAVRIVVECQGGNTLASVETARPDIAAQVVYEVVQTALADDCDCSHGIDLTALIDEMMAQGEDDTEEDTCGVCDEQFPGEDFGAENREDPNYYSTRNNGLSVEASAERAASKVANILERERPSSLDEQEIYIRPTCLQAISMGVPRNEIYNLAGVVAKEARDEGFYLGIPLGLAFQHKLIDELGLVG